jgi:tRNA 2-selenouridine synthase
MPHARSLDDFLHTPSVMLDVRSPGEYAQGHIPGAISFPLFSDEERAQVGICYKQQGRDAAVELGFAIAGPKFAGFIAQAKELAPDRQVRVYCWRGGMRSGGVGWVLQMGGFDVSLLIGGYKTYRRWALDNFEQARPILILGGMTGTGKTEVLHALAEAGEQVLDLEALASHRGSSYGSLGLPAQPSNEHFENRVACHWSQFDPTRPVWIEAESKRIGICRIPEALFAQMERSPIVEIVRSRDERLDLLVRVYGCQNIEGLIVATERIRKRLGGLRTQQAIELLQQHKFREAFDIVLDYYDKTYRYDLERRNVEFYEIDLVGRSAKECVIPLVNAAQKITQKSSAILRK